MFVAGKSTPVSFNVNVMGTSSEPTVRVVLSTHPSLTFDARKAGDKWETTLDIPASVESGSYDLSVEVVLNKRIFTPLKKVIDIAGSEKTEEPKPEVKQPEAPKVEPTKKVHAPLLRSFEPRDHDEPRTEPVVRKTAPRPKLRSFESIDGGTIIAAPVEVPPMPELTALRETVQHPPKLRRVHTPLPRPGSVSVKPITVRISEVDALTPHTTTRVVESQPAPRVKRPVGAHVRLIKEDVFYE